MRRNPLGFFDLEKQFVSIDTKKTRQCTLSQLSSCLGICGVKIRNEELEAVFKKASKGGSTANYLELISDLRGQMTKVREGAVTALFKDMDPRNQKMVMFGEVTKWLQTEKHPDVVSGRATPDSVRKDFVDKLELFGRLGVGIIYSRDLTSKGV